MGVNFIINYPSLFGSSHVAVMSFENHFLDWEKADKASRYKLINQLTEFPIPTPKSQNDILQYATSVSSYLKTTHHSVRTKVTVVFFINGMQTTDIVNFFNHLAETRKVVVMGPIDKMSEVTLRKQLDPKVTLLVDVLGDFSKEFQNIPQLIYPGFFLFIV